MIPQRAKACEKVVKRLCPSHHKCSKCKHAPKYFKGSVICSALGGVATKGVLKSDKLYRVCWNMSKRIDLYVKDSEANSKVQRLKQVSVSVGNDPVLQRRFQY